MSDRYKGAILSPTAPTVIPQSAGGVYTLSQQLQYQGQGVWPSAVNYPITKSLRFRSSASAYLSRTFGSATSTTTGTFSFWMKRGRLSNNYQYIWSASNYDLAYFDSNDNLWIAYLSNLGYVNTNAVFRDPSAWYHIMIVFDTTNATAANRLQVYVNGVAQSLNWGSTPQTQNATFQRWNVSGYTGDIGDIQFNHTNYFDGYLAEFNFIDGQALTPSSFGTTDAYGIWQPIRYSGTYGTNGFYLPFTNTTSTSTLGNDFSGNSNTWTVNNISLTSGVIYDSMTDVPTLTSATQANYPVLNAVSAYSGLPITNANIQTSAVPSGSNWFSRSTTMGISSGKWYAEFSMPSITSGNQGNPVGFGIIPASNDFSAAGQLVGDSNRGYGFYCPDTASNNPQKRVAGTSSSIGTASVTLTTDIFMVAFDLTNGNAWFGKNGTWYAGDPAAGTSASITGITAGEYLFGLSVYRDTTFTNNTAAINFGQRPFSYTPPTGFYPLNTYNLPTPTILDGDQYMNATIWTGNGTSQSITNSGSMQPDFVWYKGRSTTFNHGLFDSIRGTLQRLSSNLTSAESTTAGSLTAFNSNGFSVGSDAGANQNTDTYVGWQWRASGSTVSNTQGTITSTVSANTTAGFSVAIYTTPASGAFTVGHGLGVAPSFIINKIYNIANNWYCYHVSLGNGSELVLNTTAASVSTSDWNNTSPTSTVFSMGSGWAGSYSMISYCFAQVAGYSAFGSYTGNGSTDGPFIYLGFRPRFVLQKSTAGGNWNIWDTTRNTYNVIGEFLHPDNADAADTGSRVDVLSNGFKLRVGGANNLNDNGQTYIYACFAENPFKIANAR